MTRHSIIRILTATATSLTLLLSCGAGKKTQAVAADDTQQSSTDSESIMFSADSAYSNVARQVAFGPRVPGTDAHRQCGDWLAAKLKEYGAEVSEQTAKATTFDGNVIPMRNVFARINPDAERRVLLLAHWDTRPWADHDPDPANRDKPIDGANDGASGTGVLLEIARVCSGMNGDKGIDILLCDAEDWGAENNDESWALGARHFAQNPPIEGYAPDAAILLDMVGTPGATFMREYFSQLANPALADAIWGIS